MVRGSEARIPFSDYMDQALYGPRGYYASGAAASGRSGDYFTAPDVSPVFGRLLAAIWMHWAGECAARPFHLVELGAGEGPLARAIGQALKKDHSEQLAGLVYTAVERSEARRRLLESVGASMPCPFRVVSDVSSLSSSPVSGCFFANELIDAFPVHRVRIKQGRLEEAFVEQTSEGNHFVWDKPSTPRLEAYLSRVSLQLPEGYETEINLAMDDWIREVAAVLSSGMVVLIDYGRSAQEYYHPERTRGTLRGFSGHSVRNDVLSGDGMDMTADVDFTSLALDAKEAGLIPLAYMDMGSFLMMGARFLWEETTDRTEHPPISRVQEWAGLRYLVHPEGMGSAFQVLVLGKGLDPRDWRFEGNRLKRLGMSADD